MKFCFQYCFFKFLWVHVHPQATMQLRHCLYIQIFLIAEHHTQQNITTPKIILTHMHVTSQILLSHGSIPTTSNYVATTFKVQYRILVGTYEANYNSECKDHTTNDGLWLWRKCLLSQRNIYVLYRQTQYLLVHMHYFIPQLT